MLEKASGVELDEVILDLEDSVAAANKAEARAAATAALAGPWRPRAVSVRINGIGTEWCEDDVSELVAGPGRPLSIVVPKVESSDDLAYMDGLLGRAERSNPGSPVGLQALIESARGLMRVEEIATSSARLQALILGYADLAASLERPPNAQPAAGWTYAQERLLVAARAAGIQAIDGPHFGLAIDAGFRASAREAQQLGFDGKWAIHPAQAAALEEVFTPSREEIEQARQVIAALDAAAGGPGAGAVVALDGAMVDEAMRGGAERLLARAEGGGGE